MQTLFDYIDWRGDLPFSRDPLNPVDCLIFSVLAYIPFDGLISSKTTRKGIPLAEAAERFFSDRENRPPIREPKDVELLAAMTESERFSRVLLTAYESETDPRSEKQFSAITALPARNTVCVIFRGTDLSLTGWKEDFNMSFKCPVPAQEEAVRYLERVAPRLPGKIIVTGHSKGGNLAVYASAFCSRKTQKRIEVVYSNDGPGFNRETINRKEYTEIRNRIRSFIPHSSIIGLLLEHEEDITIIQSSAAGGLLQHDPYSWLILGTGFIEREMLTGDSIRIDRTIKTWLERISPAERELFVDTLFGVLTATGAATVTELSENWLKSALAIGKTLKNLDPATRKILYDILGEIVRAAAETGRSPKKKT